MEIRGYTNLEEISRGPVTTVFRAVQEALDRIVLLKVLNIQWNQDREFLERFRREAKISAKLNHPHIAAIFDFGMDGENFYIAMEFIHGQTLKELIAHSHPIPFPVILNLTKQICDGLSYAHNHGVIHRDIKPTNILVSHSGVVKITDFGLATVADLPSITEQGTGIGTPAYMSPEQALGKKTGTHSDLFSLGTTLYEMCTGNSPFKGETLAETITNVTRKNPVSAAKLNSAVTGWYENFLEQMLRKDPAKRLSDMVNFQAQLEAEQNFINSVNLSKYLQNPNQINKIPKPISDLKTTSAPKLWVIVMPVFIALTFILYYGMSSVLRENSIPEEKKMQSDSIPTLTRSDTTQPDSAFGRSESISFLGQEQRLADQAIATPVMQSSSTDSMTKHEESAGIESFLFIECVPWAEVYIDDKYVDTTPMDSPVQLSAGKYIIELRNPNFMSSRHLLTISSAMSETLNVSLKSKDGFLMVQAVPWADIYLNDSYLETTPLNKPIRIEAGQHILRLANPGYQAIIDTVHIQPGEQIERKYKF